MNIVVVGFNHQTAPVEVREQALFSGAAIPSAHAELRAQNGVHEVAILSTCNRTEIYTVSVCPLAGESIARSFLAKASPYLYAHRGRDAVEHLFRVASGIDSMVLGETEILGQVRRAGDVARENEAAGRVLTTLFQHAIHAGKRARSETKISHHSLSIATTAAALARAELGTLRDKKVAVIGTGMMATHAVDALRNDGIAKLTIVGRDRGRALSQADLVRDKFASVDGAALDSLPSIASDADVIIAATTCSEPILNAASIDPRSNALVIIDVGVPRNVHPDVATVEKVRYADIDDLNEVVEANLVERRREIAPVERIVADEANAFESWLRGLGVQPIITTLRSRAEEIRIEELNRAFRRLANLSPRDREIVEGLTQTIVNKLLHQPTIRLKEHANDGRGYQFAEALRDLFDLKETTE